MAGYQNALAGTMAGASVAKQSMQKPEKPKRSFGETVGRIGDILAIMGGREPVYEFYQQQRAAENAANAQREGLMGFVTGQQTPQDVARLIGLGIDPAKINALRTAGMTEPEMTALMREVAAATGFQPGTPEFRAELARQMNNRGLAGALIGGPDTGYRLNPLFQPPSAPPSTPQAPQAPPAEVPYVPTDIWRADVQTLGLPGAIRFATSKGLAVPITSDNEYDLLPSGAAFIGPDGVPRRKP